MMTMMFLVHRTEDRYNPRATPLLPLYNHTRDICRYSYLPISFHAGHMPLHDIMKSLYNASVDFAQIIHHRQQ